MMSLENHDTIARRVAPKLSLGLGRGWQRRQDGEAPGVRALDALRTADDCGSAPGSEHSAPASWYG